MTDEVDREQLASFRSAFWQRLLDDDSSYELTRFAILRLLGLVYLVAFASLAAQLSPLLGSHGLLPVAQLLDFNRERLGATAYWRVPTLFWLGAGDDALRWACSAGVVLSAMALLGATNAFLQLAIWALYTSFVHVGQIFYGYGWEIQLIETGFLAVFLCPARSLRPLPASAAPRIVIWLLRWLVFRVMVGAALIKLRNDSCWRDLTCLDYHFETQPNPNPLSYWLHHAPHGVHALGVLFNHFVELVVPFFVFGLRRVRHAAGLLLVLYQATLIASGNLSFLNWLTIVPALACFDDTAMVRLLPQRWRARATASAAGRKTAPLHGWVVRVLAVVVGLLSVAPVINLLSCQQAMNESFEPLGLVNTYGAFGNIDRARYEVILEGTGDEIPGPSTQWLQYELPCMPGDPRRRPCWISPYHYRLDWQMWFVGNGAAQGQDIEQDPWLIHLVWQLLRGEPWPKPLFAHDPFPDSPPRWIRAGIWRYRFTLSRKAGEWWTRDRVGEFLAPVSVADADLRHYVRAFGWPDRP